MKNTILNTVGLLLAVLVLFACKNEKQITQKEVFGEAVAKEKGTVFANSRVKDINQSSIHFNDAITAFEAGKMEEVTHHLRAGATALANEGLLLKGAAHQQLTKAITAIETVATNVKNGTTKDIREVEKTIAAAQLTVAHEYAVELDKYQVNIPLPDSYYPHFKAAIKAVQGAEKHLTGMAKTDAMKLVKEGQDFIDKIDSAETVSEEQIRLEKAKLTAFLKVHHLS